MTALPAEAASPSSAVPSALAAYGHYLGLILVCLCLATERLTIKAGMTEEEENRIALADITYGGAGLLVVVTGYLRVTEYGKGWQFYSHEPIFWLKMLLVAVMGGAVLASSLNPLSIHRVASPSHSIPSSNSRPLSPTLVARIP